MGRKKCKGMNGKELCRALYVEDGRRVAISGVQVIICFSTTKDWYADYTSEMLISQLFRDILSKACPDQRKSRILRMKVRENSMVLWCICPVSLQNTGSFISLMHPSPKSKRQPSNSLPSSRCTTNLITYPSASTNSSKLEVSVSCLFRDVDCPVAGRFCLRSSWKSIRLP
jgi:hypothetical protein